MANRRVYRRPPIEEALCEFHFDSDRQWDPATLEQIRTLLADEYGAEPRKQREFKVGVTIEGAKEPDVRMAKGPAGVQLATADGSRLVRVGENALRVHMLKPYQRAEAGVARGWEEFRPRIARALNAYWQVAEPVGVIRVGIRYVNKIVVPKPAVRIEDYLPYALPEVNALPETVSNFVTRVEYSYEDGVRLILSQGTVGSTKNKNALLLDIDVIRHGERIGKSQALEIANDLRERERNAFEAVITEEARRLFDED